MTRKEQIEQEEAINAKCNKLAYPEFAFKQGFITGAEWAVERMEQLRLSACKKQTKEEAEREMDFVLGFIEEHFRQPTFSDTIEITRRRMIERACKWLYGRQAVDLEVPDIEKFIKDFTKAMEE